MLQFARSLFVLSSIAFALPAQGLVDASFRATSQIKVEAVAGGAPTTRTVPPNTNLAPGVRLMAGVHGGVAIFDAAMSGDRRQGWSVRIQDLAAGQNPQHYGGGSGTSGLNRTRLTLTSSRRVVVRVIMSLKSTSQYFGTVDIGNDGVVDLVATPGTLRKEVLAVVDPVRGLPIQIQSAASTLGINPQTYSGDLRIDILPRCGAEEYGGGCATKPTLTITPTFEDTLSFELTKALPLTSTFLVLGTTRTNVLLPFLPAMGSQCLRHTDLGVLLAGKTDVFGKTSSTLNVPAGLQTKVNAQMFTIGVFGGALDIRSTAAFELECR